MFAPLLKPEVTSFARRSFVKAISLDLQVRAVAVSSDDIRPFQLVPAQLSESLAMRPQHKPETRAEEPTQEAAA